MQALTKLAAGALTAAEAQIALTNLRNEQLHSQAPQIYRSFRSWVWKAINEKRRDSELLQWHNVLRGIQTRLRAQKEYFVRFQVLQELIYESVSVSERLSPGEVSKRRHAQVVLRLLAREPSRWFPRLELKGALGLKEANLSRLLGLLTAAGLLDRRCEGREALFQLSREGLNQASCLAPTQAEFQHAGAQIRKSVAAYSSLLETNELRSDFSAKVLKSYVCNRSSRGISLISGTRPKERYFGSSYSSAGAIAVVRTAPDEFGTAPRVADAYDVEPWLSREALMNHETYAD